MPRGRRELLPHSLSARVTTIFVLGGATALALCLVLLYLAMDRQLSGTMDADLTGRSTDLAAALAAGDADVVATDPLAQLYTGDGRLLTSSAVLGDWRLLSAGEVRAVRHRITISRSVPTGSGGFQDVRLLSRRLGSDQVLTVGVSAEPLQEARQRLLTLLLIAGPVLLGLLAVAGWLVVRAALRPVDALTREAAEITSLESGRTLSPVAGDDEIARLARTLDAMLARLAVTFQRERAFVDDASHELRSPIAVLRGELELAVAALDDKAEVERSLRAALAETDRLTRLAEELLLLARERAGMLILDRTPVNLVELAADEAKRLGPPLELDIDVVGPPTVVAADPDRLRQVLGNLAHNSATAGARSMQIRVSRDRDAATLQVADDGPGFPAEVADSAFDRFVRADRARTPGSAGAGLGLSIVRAVITAHGGTIEAGTGAPLGGAVVTARLPLS
ncbi:MAG TPA: ATP-binding protein [Actinomycetes bacterium]|nr:ATP-binding protein [Actinomycetes bacterium]